MSRTLRWILGILAVLVAVALVAGAIWFFQHRTQIMATYQPNAPAAPGAPNLKPGQGQPRGPFGFGDDRRPLRGWDRHGPMMRQHGFTYWGPGMPFGMGLFFMGGLFRLIIPVAVLAVVAVLFYQMGRRAGASSTSSPPPSARSDT